MTRIRSSAAYRIAVAYAAILAWTVLLLGAAVYVSTDRELRRLGDAELASELRRLSRQTDLRGLLREIGPAAGQEGEGAFRYALFNGAGRRIGGGLALDQPPSGFATLLTQGNAGEVASIRVGVTDVAAGHRLVVARGEDGFDVVRRRIVAICLAALAVVLLSSVLGGLLLGRYLRYRLHPISATAHAIVTGNIEWRVPVGAGRDEFDKAAVAVNLMLDRIAGLMDNLRQVSSDIAHDLRKPLMRLLLQADRLGEVEGAEQRVIEMGDELLMLFAGILRIAEIEGGGLERSFASLDLSDLMNEVAESFAPALADSGQQFEWSVEPGISVIGSIELLAQLAANLLDNARIHTPPGSRIRLVLASTSSEVRLMVEDDGPGVPDADRDRLLQRFFRSEGSRTTAGNGLGLSLAAATAGAHGGAIAIEDAGPGLRVVVTFPKKGN